MKRFFLLAVFAIISFNSALGQVGINTDGSDPDPSAMLDVKSASRGFLPPRVPLTAVNTAFPIVAPAPGLLVYNTAIAGIPPNLVVPGYYYWNGAGWTALAISDSIPFRRDTINQRIYSKHAGDVLVLNRTDGTAFLDIMCPAGGTNPAINVNDESGKTVFHITKDGRVGIGQSTPEAKLEIITEHNGQYELGVRCSNDTSSPVIILTRSRGSYASSSPVQDGDILGNIIFRGENHLGAGSEPWAAQIAAIADHDLGGDTVPAALSFSTGGYQVGQHIAPTWERLRITSRGNVEVHKNLNVAGSATLQGNLYLRQVGDDPAPDSVLTIAGGEIKKTAFPVHSAGQAQTPAVLLLHSPGEHYGGGVVFYVYDGGLHGLVAAVSDQDPGVSWNNGVNTTTNAARTRLLSGQFNTGLIICSQGAGNFAAQRCAGYEGGDFSDWYLPSLYELNLLYQQHTVVGGFSGASYWSSSEIDDAGAWAVDFATGTPQHVSKGAMVGVRAIRAF